jgi:hypothetical protein
MLGRLGALVVVVAVLGCGSTNAGENEGGTSAECEALSARWHDLVASLSLACQQDSDCTVAGVQIGSDEHGANGPIAGTGVAVNAAAYLQSPASGLEVDWMVANCGGHLDYICVDDATCADGSCTNVRMNCCGTRGPHGFCPFGQGCYYDESSSGSVDGCLSQSYGAPKCTSDCPSASICGGSCCGPGTMCSNPDWACCVLIPDAGVPPDGGDCAHLSAPTVLAEDQNDPADIAVDASRIYWVNRFTSESWIMQMPVTGGTPTTLARIGDAHGTMAVSAAGVFWPEPGGQRIMSVPLTGGTPVALAYGLVGPLAITADATSVYWTRHDQYAIPPVGEIMMVAATGGAPVTLASGPMYPSAIAVDDQAVYWFDGDTRTILSVPLAGGTPVTLASQQLAGPMVSDGVRLYWINYNYGYDSGDVMKMPVAGGTPMTVADFQHGLTGIAVDATSVYWTTSDGPGLGAVWSVPISGGAPVRLACGQDWPQLLAVDATRVYWTNDTSPTTHGTVAAVTKQSTSPSDAAPDDGPIDAGTD